MRISKNVEILEIKGEHGKIYPVLLWDESELVLIDAGFPLQIKLIEEAVKMAGFTIDKITKIILTHQDIDHIGNVKELIGSVQDLKVFAHEVEAPFIDGRKTPVKIAQMEANLEYLPEDKKAWYNILKTAFENRRISINETLKDLDVLPICGGIEIIHTPGHTPGHICIYLKEIKTLVAGDALNIENGELVGCNPGYTYDLEESKKSIEKLLKYDIHKIVTYHGGIFEGDIRGAILRITQKI